MGRVGSRERPDYNEVVHQTMFLCCMARSPNTGRHKSYKMVKLVIVKKIISQHMGDDWDEVVLNRMDCFMMRKNYLYTALAVFVSMFTITFIVAVMF